MPAVSLTSRSSTRSSSSVVAAISGTSSITPPTSSPAASGPSGISTVYATATVTVNAPFVTSTASQNAKHSSTLPAGIVAGAVAGSVVLAIILVLGWTYWAKKLQDRKRREHGTTLTTQKWRGSRPRTYKRTSSGSFADSETAINGLPDSSSEKVGMHDRPTPNAISPTAPPNVSFGKPKRTSRRILQKNRRANEHRRRQSTLSPIIDVDNENAEPTSPSPSSISEAPPRYSSPAIQYPSNVIRKPSTVGSTSIYSTQSGEERHMSADADLLRAALGNSNYLAAQPASISHKPSNVSSVYSSQSGEDREYTISTSSPTMFPQQRRLTGWTPSLGSMYSASESEQPPLPEQRSRLGLNVVGVPSRLSQFSYHSPNEVGVAFGGEEAL